MLFGSFGGGLVGICWRPMAVCRPQKNVVHPSYLERVEESLVAFAFRSLLICDWIRFVAYELENKTLIWNLCYEDLWPLILVLPHPLDLLIDRMSLCHRIYKIDLCSLLIVAVSYTHLTLPTKRIV